MIYCDFIPSIQCYKQNKCVSVDMEKFLNTRTAECGRCIHPPACLKVLHFPVLAFRANANANSPVHVFIEKRSTSVDPALPLEISPSTLQFIWPLLVLHTTAPLGYTAMHTLCIPMSTACAVSLQTLLSTTDIWYLQMPASNSRASAALWPG